MQVLQQYVLEEYKSLIKEDENGKFYVLEEDIESLDVNKHARAFIILTFKTLDIYIREKTITKDERSSKVRDFDFGNIEGNALGKYDEAVKSELEYENENLIFENYEELDEYILNEFIPNNIQLKVNRGPIEDGQKVKPYPSIQLNKIVKLKLNEAEIRHVIDLLNKEGIRVGGVSSDLDSEFINYDYIRTYATKKYEKPLSAKEAMEKHQKYYETKDPIIREELINRNLRLVAYVAWKVGKRHELDSNVLLSYGYEGLLHSIENYNPYQGAKFSTYAFACIEGEMKRGIPVEKGIPDRNHYYMFERAKYIVEKEYGQKYDGSEEMLDDILDLLVTVGDISEASKKTFKLEQGMKSLEGVYENSDIISSIDFDDMITSDVATGILKNTISNALADLKEKEKEVIIARFGLRNGQPKTLDDVGKMFNITRERVRQIEARALRKLRRPVRSDLLKDYLGIKLENDTTSNILGEISDVIKEHSSFNKGIK